MFIVDSHCDSIQKVDTKHFDLVNPYNYSRKHPQLQFVAMMTGWPDDTEKDSWRRACRYTGLYCMSIASESDKVLPVTCYADIELWILLAQLRCYLGKSLGWSNTHRYWNGYELPAFTGNGLCILVEVNIVQPS